MNFASIFFAIFFLMGAGIAGFGSVFAMNVPMVGLSSRLFTP